MRRISRGDVFYADCGAGVGSEQTGIRPVVIIQNNIGNRYSPTVIVAMVTSRHKKSLPTHVYLHNPGFSKPSCVLTEQIRTISTDRLRGYVCTLKREEMQSIDNALKQSLAIA